MYSFFRNLTEKDTFHQFIRYTAVGILSFLTEYILFLLIYKKFEIWYAASSVIVYFIVFWLNFLLNRHWTFNSTRRPARQLLFYFILFSLNALMGTGMIVFLSDVAGIAPVLSKALIMLVIVPWNFILYKKVIYA